VCLLRGVCHNSVRHTPDGDDGSAAYQEETRRCEHHEGEHKGVFSQILALLAGPKALVYPEMLCHVPHESPNPFSIRCFRVVAESLIGEIAFHSVSFIRV